MPLDSTEIVFVTGGAGFLGQHIVKHLLKETQVKEIRVFDTRSFSNRFSIDNFPTDDKRVKSIIGDITKTTDVIAAIHGCTAVIHCAAMVDFQLFPDKSKMHEVNVKGTENVIQACILCNVSYLVFTSTIDVAVGNAEIINGDESIRLPERCLIHDYGNSKQKAEALVRAADGRRLSQGDGRTLRTVCLRSSVMYGEGDPFLIPTAILSASKVLVRVGDGKALSQYAYVGNVAWAHVCALQALVECDTASQDISGRVYFVNDDTPLMNAFQFFELFLPKCGRRVSKFRVPFSIVYCVLFVVQCFLFALRPVFPVNLKTTLSSLVYVNRTVFFSRAQAQERLRYVPKYDFATSLNRSLDYYIRTFA